jgi:two-component system, chemotaxis family, sensor kinase CheA
MDELLADFLTETNEGLAEADRALLRLEQVPRDQSTLAIVFRAIHTIKGSSGFLPLPRLGRVAHAAEDVLVGIRDGAVAVDPTMVSGLLAALDRIKLIIDGISRTGGEPHGDDASLIAELAVLSRGEAGPALSLPGHAGDKASGNAATTHTIRVGVGLLENLMTLVSELVLTRNQLIQLAPDDTAGPFATALQRLSHLTSDLQEGVMKTRMQPIGSLNNTLTRVVRGLGQELGKSIAFVMAGADTELDRQVLELMRDPLIHMVRNSADHGLEGAALRRAAGKPATGRISLTAYHEDGHVVIELGDDGAGLPIERIRTLALAHGLATETELATMNEAQIQRFIFRPGFSTAASVSAVSGRGVGMEVVKANIERIGGTIALHSSAGRGTVFTIRIPLTLAIISAFILETRGERFALPQVNVMEVVRLGDAEDAVPEQARPVLESIDGTPMLRLRDRLLPLIHLGEILRLDGPQQETVGSIVVVLSVNAAIFGLVVDRVFDTAEIVVKPMAPLLRHITMFGGKTILGDGSIIMILEPNGIARTAGLGTPVLHPRLAEPRKQLALHASPDAERSGDLSPMLLFRAGIDAAPVAVPLSLVSRIEQMPISAIETSSNRPVTQYRGTLMPLVAMEPIRRDASDSVPVLVFTDRSRSMGLIVHEVVDIVEQTLMIELSAARPELLGTAVIGGRVTDVIDAGYWLVQAWQDWFHHEPSPAKPRKRLLVVEDSGFFRQLLVPMLAASGFDVTAVDSAARAIALRNTTQAVFDAIISDVEMPGIDGLEFARRLREGGPWRYTPLLALSGRFSEADAARGREAGFSEYVGKLDRATLLAAVHRCVAPAELRIA